MKEGKNEYNQEVTCTNCGRAQHFIIPKGTSVSNFLCTVVCVNCGCNPQHQPLGIRQKGEDNAEAQ